MIGKGRVTDDKNSMSCGNGSTTCRIAYNGSGTVTFIDTPATGWNFTDWDGDDATCRGATCTVTLDLADDDHEVIANFDQTPDPVTSSSTSPTTATPRERAATSPATRSTATPATASDCSEQTTTGSTLTLVETPDDGYIFTSWGGACSGAARACIVTLTDKVNVSGTFRKPKLSVTVNGGGTVTGGGITCTGGQGSSGCSADQTAGQDVALTATPASGGSFQSWSGCTSSQGTTCTVSMTADKSVTANFSGGGSTGPTTFALSVSVTGSGTVTGNGINCGVSATTCSTSLASGTSVTLTATPSSGQTFQSWGGACSGTSATCTLTMSAARSVSATFSGGSSAEVTLDLAVTGRGTVTGGGITCGNGKDVCSAKAKQGSTVGLTATPARGAKFKGWGGACSGTTTTCTVEMSAAKEVTAAFTGSAPASGSVGLRRIGPAVVARTGNGFAVTLRFHTAARGHARVRALRAGRVETALAFTAAPGTARVGPFPFAKSGFYEFELRLGARTLRWTACLGRCGEHASSTPFTLTRGLAAAVDAGALWSVTLHFRSTAPAGADVRVYRGGRLARQVSFPIHAGAITPGALLLSPGNYQINLEAVDAYGRIRTLAWYALLP